MSQKKYTLLVVGALLLGACNNNEETPKGNYPSDCLVRINTTVSERELSELEETRADDPTPYGGTDLSLSIDYGLNRPYTSLNMNWIKENSIWKPIKPMYWESAEKEASIYAYAPYIYNVYDIEKIPFSVQTNQSSGLATSDLLGYVNNSFKPNYNLSSANDLNLIFAHKLSKLTVNFSFKSHSEFGDQPPTIQKVTLNGTKPKVIYNARIGNAVIDNSSNPTAITMCPVSGNSNSYEVILAPQTVAGSTNMITVELLGGYTCSYTVPASTSHQFDPSKAYKMDLLVGKEKMDLGSVTVTGWKPGISPTPEDVAQLKITYQPIEAGEFQMGRPEGEVGEDNERPVHKVKLSSFYMSECEITNAQYCAFLNANKIDGTGKWSGAKFENKQQLIYDSSQGGRNNRGVTWDTAKSKWVPALNYDKFPVIYVTWYGAKEFALWVGGDLPTEAQWEFACRGKTTYPWWPGDNATVLKNYAWFLDNYTGYPHEVKTTSGDPKGNLYGLCDMHGNVKEWCNDLVVVYTAADQKDPSNPPVPGNNSARVVRGGGYDDDASICRSAYRDSGRNPAYYGNSVGFRVVFSVLP